MTTHTGLRLGAVALVILSIALVGGAHLCGVALDKAATDPGMRPIGSGALACTEFWLNRYQTLVAALIAGSIALWAGRLLFKQVEAQRFDFFARQLVELRSIRASADDLNAICNGKIGPDVKIRVRGERNTKSMFALMFEIAPEEFLDAVNQAREKLIRLESSARQPIGPSETARRAEALVQAAAEYLRYCTVDVFPRQRLAHLGSHLGLGPLPFQTSDFAERSPGTRERNLAVCDAYNELAEAFELELRQIEASQARAHSAVR